MTLKENKPKLKDIGKFVLHVPSSAKGDVNHKDCREGTISSWNFRKVFVIFDDAPVACKYSELHWY